MRDKNTNVHLRNLILNRCRPQSRKQVLRIDLVPIGSDSDHVLRNAEVNRVRHETYSSRRCFVDKKNVTRFGMTSKPCVVGLTRYIPGLFVSWVQQIVPYAVSRD